MHNRKQMQYYGYVMVTWDGSGNILPDNRNEKDVPDRTQMEGKGSNQHYSKFPFHFLLLKQHLRTQMAVVLERTDTHFGAKLYTHQAIDRSHLMEAYCTWLHPYTVQGSQLARNTMVQAPSWVLQKTPYSEIELKLQGAPSAFNPEIVT